MYNFLLNLWVFGRLTDTQLNNAVAKGYVTQVEADQIAATPKGV